MGISTIDIFPLFKQWKAAILPAYPYKDRLAIATDHGYGSWRADVQIHKNFQRGIKEDI